MKYAVWIIITICCLWADGGFIPPTGGFEILSADQVALIRHFQDSEELMIMVRPSPEASQGFAWIIPLPSQPEIKEVDVQLFFDMANITAPIQEGAGCSGPFFAGGRGDNYGQSEEFLDVIAYDTIGFVQYLVIHTNNTDTLITWLSNNNYEIQDGMETLLDEYLAQDWCYFFFAQIDSNAFDPFNLDENVGISFTFSSSQPVYPMEITSLSAFHHYDLFVYVISDHKMFFDDATLQYANRISAKELDAIANDHPTLAEYLDTGHYITKLKRVYEDPATMEDIILYQAADDTEYRSYYDPQSYYGGALNSMLAPLIFYLLLMACWRIIRKRRLANTAT